MKFLPVIRLGVRDGVSREDVSEFLAKTEASRTSCPSRSRGGPTNSGFEMYFWPKNGKWKIEKIEKN